MDPDDLTVAPNGLVNESRVAVATSQRLGQRGPVPLLSGAEVLTLEVVGDSRDWSKTRPPSRISGATRPRGARLSGVSITRPARQAAT
jgi:hypothetical protein